MGSPLDALPGDAFLEKLETTKSKSVTDSFEYYYRYVDDVFLVSHYVRDLNSVQMEFKKASKIVRFTVEGKVDKHLLVLDALP